MSPPPLWRLLAKRTLAVWPLVLASFGAVLLAATLLATGPLYAESAAQAGLERKLADAEPRAGGIDVSSRVSATDFATLTARVQTELRRALPGAIAQVERVAEADSAPAGDGRRFALASFGSLQRHARLVAGRWPRAGGRELEAVVSRPAAAATGLSVGSSLALGATSTVEARAVRVVGLYTVADETAVVWWNDPLALDGSRGRVTPTVGPLVVDEAALLAHAQRVRASWRTRPDARALDVDGLERAAAAVASLEERLREGVPVGEAPPVVSTELPTLLEETRRELGIARSGVLVPLAQLALLAGYGLVFVSSLIRRRRRREDRLLLMRGADSRALALASATEALTLAAVAALVAPWLAAAAIEGLSSSGPIAAVSLELEPHVGRLAYLLAAAGAFGALAALLVPALLGERRESRSRIGILQRTGLDIALLVAAGATLWQLRSEGAPVVAGDGELDVLLVAIPAVGIVSGAVLAGRVVPAALAAFARLTAARRGAVAVLGARRLARSAHEHRPAAVLLIAAVAIGTFAASYVATWERTQTGRATVAVGADVLVADDRRSDGYPPIGRAAAFASVEGVAAASPVVREQLTVGDAPVPLIAVDAAAAPVAAAGATKERQPALLAELARRRPESRLPLLPDGDAIVVQARTVIEPLPPGARRRTGFIFGARPALRFEDLAVALAVVVQDADGFFHRLEPQPLAIGPRRLVFDLDGGSEEAGVRPRTPLRLAGLEILYRMPGFVARVLRIQLDAPVTARWSVRMPLVSRVISRPEARARGSRTLRVRLATGASRYDRRTGAVARVSANVALVPDGGADADEEPLPAIAGSGLLDALDARIGDVVEVEAGAARRRLELIGALDAFATATGGDRFLVADLPTLLAHRYRVTQETVRPDAWVLTVDGATPRSVVAGIRRPPLAAAEATSRELTESGLRNDPLAVATSGALWLGFFAAALFAVATFSVAGAAQTRAHAADGAVLHGLGLSRRGARTMVVLEDATLAVAGAAVGAALGIALGLLVLPAVAFTETGAAAVPRPDVTVPALTVALLAGGVVAAIVVAAFLRSRGAGAATPELLREPVR